MTLQTRCSENGSPGLQDQEMPPASIERRRWHRMGIAKKFSAGEGVERHLCAAHADMPQPFFVLEIRLVRRF
jgi:hypothetical protein